MNEPTELTIRRMGAGDEPVFINLLRKVYGETYSYKDLYEPGGYSGLISNDRVAAFGEFNHSGSLIGHTAVFFKDPNNDYAESGLSMRQAGIGKFIRGAEKAGWDEILKWVGSQVPFLHQHTTTYHLLAQKYAALILKTKLTGIVVNYATGEELVGLKCPKGPMQALSQTSVLNNLDQRCVELPINQWSEWLSRLFKNLGRVVQITFGSRPMDSLKTIEENDSLQLRRRVLVAGSREGISNHKARVDLIHVPCEGWDLDPLFSQEYLPVGVRPHLSRPDEVILQYIPRSKRRQSVAYLQHANIASRKARSLVSDWIELCEETLTTLAKLG